MPRTIDPANLTTSQAIAIAAIAIDHVLDAELSRGLFAPGMPDDPYWNVPAAPRVGDRIRLRREVSKYPHFIAEAGLTGTVTESSADDISGLISVRMDEPLAGAEAWDNEILWGADDDQDYADFDREPYAVVPFWRDCALIVDAEKLS